MAYSEQFTFSGKEERGGGESDEEDSRDDYLFKHNISTLVLIVPAVYLLALQDKSRRVD